MYTKYLLSGSVSTQVRVRVCARARACVCVCVCVGSCQVPPRGELGNAFMRLNLTPTGSYLVE